MSEFYHPPGMPEAELKALHMEMAVAEHMRAQKCIDRAAALMVEAAEHTEIAHLHEAHFLPRIE